MYSIFFLQFSQGCTYHTPNHLFNFIFYLFHPVTSNHILNLILVKITLISPNSTPTPSIIPSILPDLFLFAEIEHSDIRGTRLYNVRPLCVFCKTYNTVRSTIDKREIFKGGIHVVKYSWVTGSCGKFLSFLYILDSTFMSKVYSVRMNWMYNILRN